MPLVKMPDGTVVNMPDQLDPALGARLRAFQAGSNTPAEPPGFAASQNATAATHQPTGDLSGVLSGLAELFGTSLANIPGGTMHGIHDIVSRATGNGPAPAYKPDFVPSPNAQAVGESIAGHTPHVPTVGTLLNLIPGVKEFHDQYIAPVKQDVSQVAAGAGIAAPMVSAVRGGVADAFAADANSPVTQLANQGWKMRPSDVAKASGPGAQPTVVGGALQSAVGDQAAAQTVGPQNALLAQQKAAATTGIKLDSNNIMTPQAIADAKAPHAAVYEELANVPGEGTPGTYTQQLNAIREDKTLSPDAQAAVNKLADAHSELGNSASVLSDVKALRQKASNLIQNDNPDLQDRGFAMKAMADAQEQVLADRATAAGQPDLAARFQAARKSYAQISSVEDASKAGSIDPQALLKARNKGQFMSGGLADITNAAEQLPDVVKHQHAFSGGASALPTTLPGAAQGIFRNLGGRALLNGPYQNSLRTAPGLGGQFAPTAAEAPGATIGSTPPPTQGGPPATAVPTAGITATPIEPKLGDIMPGQRGAVGPPVDIGELRKLMNSPQTYKNGPIDIPKGAAKKPGAANDKKFGPFRGNPQTLEDFLRENLGDNF